MRVVNDREERTETSEVGFLSLLTHVLMVSIGMATFMFAPVPMILSHLRLLEPWSKVAVVLGSVIALVALEVPVSMVVLSFVFGLYLADAVTRKNASLWGLLLTGAAIAISTAALILFTEASLEKVSPITYWTTEIAALVAQMKEVVQVGSNVEWNLIQALLFYEGPFIIFSGAIVSAWISIGICAHAGWLGEKNQYVASSLRKLKPSSYFSLGFGLALLASRVVTDEYKHIFGGLGRVFAVLLFVQGTLELSRWMSFRNLNNIVRTVFYSFFVLLGFYALIAIGIFSPVLFRNRVKKLTSGKISLMKTEEAI